MQDRIARIDENLLQFNGRLSAFASSGHAAALAVGATGQPALGDPLDGSKIV
jgi:hypothetical protein